MTVDSRQCLFEFAARWNAFGSATVKTYLDLFLAREYGEVMTRFETCKPEEVLSLQGRLEEIRRLQRVLGMKSDDALESLKSVLTYNQEQK